MIFKNSFTMRNCILFVLFLLSLGLAFACFSAALDGGHWILWVGFSVLLLLIILLGYVLVRRLWRAHHAAQNPNLANVRGDEQASLVQPQDHQTQGQPEPQLQGQQMPQQGQQIPLAQPQGQQMPMAQLQGQQQIFAQLRSWLTQNWDTIVLVVYRFLADDGCAYQRMPG